MQAILKTFINPCVRCHACKDILKKTTDFSVQEFQRRTLTILHLNRISSSCQTSLNLLNAREKRGHMFLDDVSGQRQSVVNIQTHSISNNVDEDGCETSKHKHDKVPTRLRKKTIKEQKLESMETNWVAPSGRDTGVMVYNSLTKKKVPLYLPNGRLASWYICGPTVYDHTHIGHACTYIRFDVLRRILTEFFNIDVVTAMGITDIDDKIIQRAKELRVDHVVLARQFENEFHKDMAALKVLPPTVILRVTELIPKIIRYTQTILDNGCAYTTPTGSVYFDVAKYGRYGKWSRIADTDIRETADKEKKNPRDFALWKTAKPGEPFWESPWGKGRPGWHIECSTMASDIFGEHLDIHSGGQDLLFPHHENEIAQSQAYFCCEQWGNYWLHSGHLRRVNEEEKMSKSLKNTISVSKLLQKYTANQFRMFCILQHYRSGLEFSDEIMQRAVSTQQQLASFLGSADAYIKGQLACNEVDEQLLFKSLIETKIKVRDALADDFDTPRAVGALMDLVRVGNKQLQQRSKDDDIPRSPGVFAFMVTYIDSVLEMMGVQFTGRKTLYSTEANQQLSQVLDSAVKFRNHIRLHALQSKSAVQPDRKPLPDVRQEPSKKERHTLLKACDEFRDSLALTGFQIKDYGKESSWQVEEKKQIRSDSFNPSHPKYGNQ